MEKLWIVYDSVEQVKPDTYIVGHGGRHGLIMGGKVRIPVRHHHINFMERFIVAGVSMGGAGRTTVYNRDMERIIPPSGSKYDYAEIYSIEAWEGAGLVLLTRDYPTYKNQKKLIFLHNDGRVKIYMGVGRMPMSVEGSDLLAIAAPGANLDTRSMHISPEYCADQMDIGGILEVLDKDFRVHELEDVAGLI